MCHQFPVRVFLQHKKALYSWISLYVRLILFNSHLIKLIRLPAWSRTTGAILILFTVLFWILLLLPFLTCSEAVSSHLSFCECYVRKKEVILLHLLAMPLLVIFLTDVLIFFAVVLSKTSRWIDKDKPLILFHKRTTCGSLVCHL